MLSDTCALVVRQTPTIPGIPVWQPEYHGGSSSAGDTAVAVGNRSSERGRRLHDQLAIVSKVAKGRAGVADWAVAAAVTAALLISGLSGAQTSDRLDLAGSTLLVVSGLALVAGRRAPVVVLAVTGSCAVVWVAIGFDVPAIAYLVAVYGAFRAGHRIAAVTASVLMLAAVPLAFLAAHQDWPFSDVLMQSRDILPLAWLIAAGAAGEALRQAERRVEEVERSREEAARRRADEERLRIARELHDSLTHQISVIKVQAEVAVHLTQKQGIPAPEYLLAILEAGREATRELRSTLEALRHDETPAPGIDNLPALVRQTHSAGLETHLTIEGDRAIVPAAVDRTAYRIVQESLTNVNRHAAATTASVRLDYRSDALVIQVDDDGTAIADSAPSPGVGLLGMRERVAGLGGQLQAAPRIGGGFTVRAELPVRHLSS
jgi:signal transduction histidine kinase